MTALEPETTETVAATGPRMLVVDDDPEVREIFVEYFAARGYRVQDASTAGEALMVLRACRPDVVLLDLHMPGDSGLALLPELTTITPPVAVVVVTANTDVALAQESLRLGAVDYVTKPCDLARLEAIVRNALHVAGSQASGHDGRGEPDDEARWADLMHTVLNAGHHMGHRARLPLGERLQNAVVMAVRAARHGDADVAERHLREVELLVRLATELGDVPLSVTLAVEAARARTLEGIRTPRTQPALARS
jgi:DNA-binding response OmpR family regulator